MSALVIAVPMALGMVLMLAAVLRLPAPHPATPRWVLRARDTVVRSGIEWLTPGRLGLGMAAVTATAFLVLLGLTRAWPIALTVAVLTGAVPAAVVIARANRRAAAARAIWPDVVDALIASVRAGMGLPESVAALEGNGPEALIPHLAAYGRVLRTTGSFDQALTRLKDSLADPVADRIVESLRLARDVGGADLGHLLRNLGVMLREDARIQGELRARASWTVNAARLGVAAPWLVLVLISTRSDTAAVYTTPQGILVLAGGACACLGAYALMRMIGRVPGHERTLR